MALDQLEITGMRAVFEGVDTYIRGAEAANKATAGVAKATSDAGVASSKAAPDIAKVGDASVKAADGAEKAQGAVGKLVGALGKIIAIAAPVAAALGAAFSIKKGIEAVTELGGQVGNLQRITGDTAENASRLVATFTATGVGVDRGTIAVTKFAKALGGVADLEDGIAIPVGGALAKVLFDLGVRTKDATDAQRPFNDVLGDLSDVFKGMPDGVEKTALATQLFGRNGKDLLPFLNKGREGLKELGDEAARLGLVLDESQVKQTKAFKAAKRQLGEATKGILVQLGLAFLPIATFGATVAAKLAAGLNTNVIPFIKTLAQVLSAALGPIVIKLTPILAKFATAFTNFTKNAIFTGLTKGVPLVIAFSKAMGDLFRVFKNGFRDFDLGAENIGGLPAVLQPIAVLVSILGAALRKVVDDFKAMAEVAVALVAGLRFLAGGVDNIRLAALLAGGPLGTILGLLADLVERVTDFFDKTGAGEGIMKRFSDRLGDLSGKIIPAVAIALEGLLGLLALKAIGTGIGQLINFGQTLADLALGPLKLAAGLVSDFVTGVASIVGKAIDITANIIGTAFDFLTALAGYVANGASFVVNATVKTAQTVADFVKGLVDGINAELKTRPIQLQLPEGGADEAGQKAGQSFFRGLLRVFTTPGNVGTILLNVLSGILSGVAAAVVVSPAGQLFVASLTTTLGAAISAAAIPIAALAGGAILFALSSYLFGFKDTLRAFLIGVIGGTNIVGVLASLLESEVGTGKALGAIGGAITAGVLIALGSVVLLKRRLDEFIVYLNTTVLPGASDAAYKIGKAIQTFIIAGVKALFTDPTSLIDFGKFVGSLLKNLSIDIAIGFKTGLFKIGNFLSNPLASVRDKLKAFGKSVSDSYRAVYKRINEITSGGLDEVRDGLKSIGSIFSGTSLGGSIFRPLFSGIDFGSIADTIIGGLRRALLAAWNDSGVGFTILPLIRKLTEFDYGDLTRRVVGGLKKILLAAWNDDTASFTVLPLIRNIVEFDYAGLARTIISGLTDAFKTGLSGIGQIFSDAFGGISEIVKDALSDVAPTVVGALTGALTSAKGLMGQIFTTITGGFAYIVNGVRGIVSGLAGVVGVAFDGVGRGLTAAVGFIAGKVAGIINRVTDALSRVGFGDNPFGLNDLRDALRALESSGRFPEPNRQPGEPAPGQPVLPGLPGSGNPGLETLAVGTAGPLLRATAAMVGENGTELALLRRGRALLPAGTEVLNAGSTRRILAALSGLPARASGGARAGLELNMPFSVMGGGELDWGQIRSQVHFAVDEKLSEARIQSQRAGSRLSQSIGN